MAYSAQRGHYCGTRWYCLVVLCLSFTIVVSQTDNGSASVAVDPTDSPDTLTPETLTPETLLPETPTPDTLAPETLTPETSPPKPTSPATRGPTPTPTPISPTPTSPISTSPTPTPNAPTTNVPTTTPSTTSTPTPVPTSATTPAPDPTSKQGSPTLAPGPASSSSGGSSASGSDNSTKSSSSLGLAAIIGIAVGCVVLMVVLLAFFIAQRRRHKNRESEYFSDGMLELAKEVRPLDNADKDHRGVIRTAAKSSSFRRSIPDETQYRTTLSEDPVILASRIPIDGIELGAVIGRGAFGEVYRGRYRGQDVAIKALIPEKRKSMEHIEAFLSEVKLIATMEHPNIVQFIGVAWESLSDLYCVIEFMTNGDLRTLLKEYHASGVPQGMDASKMQIAYGVSYALTYLHSLEPLVLHRDLKSRNILLTESLTAKITDFGASRVRSEATMTSNVGSSLWMAPEVMMGERYDDKADIFSFGVVISELDTQELPYSHAKECNSKSGHALSDTAVLQMVAMGKLRVHFSPAMHPEMIEFVERCVSVDPQERPTAAEVLYYLQVAIRNKKY